MAKSSKYDDQYNCSVCLDLMTDPVTIPCGHSYCKACIKDYWDQGDLQKISCPQCRQIFNPRPSLNKNTMLAEMLENLRCSGPQDSNPALSVTDLRDITCVYCPQLKAVKSCLECRASYCQTHLQSHYDLPALKKHNLVNVISMQTCPIHDKPLEVFCQTDQTCVCTLCLLVEHKGHEIVSPAEERQAREVILQDVKSRFREKRSGKSQQLKELETAITIRVATMQQTVEDTELAFTSLISFLEQRRNEVIERIRAHERDDVDQAESRQEELELQIATLMGQEDIMEQLLNSKDNIYFLQNFGNMPSLSEVQMLQDVDTPSFSGDLSKTVSECKDKLELYCKQEVDKLLDEVTLKQRDLFKIGDKVRVKRSVSTPKHRWGKVTYQSVGVITDLNGDDITVDFPEHLGWKGIISEMEVVPFSRASDSDIIRIGDKVRVKPSVATPKHEWGGITHKSVGEVKAFADDIVIVDFPEFTGWKGLSSEMEKTDPGGAGSSIRVGDTVRVKASVKSPKHGWGEASHESVGVVTALKGDDVTVRFPEQAGWIGVISEMELVHEADSERRPRSIRHLSREQR